MQDSNFHLVDSRPTRTKPFGPRRNQFQHKNRNADKDDYRSLHPGGKAEQERNRQKQQKQQQQYRGRFWNEQRVRQLLCSMCAFNWCCGLLMRGPQMH